MYGGDGVVALVKIQTEESILHGHEELCRELIAGLTVMDDILMRNVLNQTECTEYVPQTN